ncbi:hypothetical protein FCM35_KLT05593 [Carex littledalei]|uniref:Uncharacterized protein n=1 Tax=Carex littledalei TaxID=544730 RepID=A0A833VJ31_9POAL|nr:hypothetical protein FCM35_KLT05593 [Carex littledalei]
MKIPEREEAENSETETDDERDDVDSVSGQPLPACLPLPDVGITTDEIMQPSAKSDSTTLVSGDCSKTGNKNRVCPMVAWCDLLFL